MVDGKARPAPSRSNGEENAKMPTTVYLGKATMATYLGMYLSR